MTRIALLALVGALAAAPAAPAVADEIPHFATIEEAVANANGRDIIVDFTGSDWCHWCIKLKQEVFTQDAFKAGVKDKYVMVELDFPRDKPQSAETKAYNKKLNEAWGVEGYPTIFVLDAKGRPYAKTGYERGGPPAYLKHLAKLATQRDAIAKARAAYDGAEAPEKLKSLDALITTIDGYGVGLAYLSLKEKAIELDADNKAGLRVKYAAQLAQKYLLAGEKAKGTKYYDMVKALDAHAARAIDAEVFMAKEINEVAKAGNWQAVLDRLNPWSDLKGETGQRVHFFTGMVHYRMKANDKAIASLETARTLAPKGALVEQITKSIEFLKKQ